LLHFLHLLVEHLEQLTILLVLNLKLVHLRLSGLKALTELGVHWGNVLGEVGLYIIGAYRMGWHSWHVLRFRLGRRILFTVVGQLVHLEGGLFESLRLVVSSCKALVLLLFLITSLRLLQEGFLSDLNFFFGYRLRHRFGWFLAFLTFALIAVLRLLLLAETRLLLHAMARPLEIIGLISI